MSTADGPTPGAPLPDATASLPDDPVILQQMIRELLAVLRQTRHENEQLQHRLDLLLRRLYGPRTERFDPNQPLLIPDAFEAAAVPTKQDTPEAPPLRNRPLPQNRSSAVMVAGHCPRISLVWRSSTS